MKLHGVTALILSTFKSCQNESFSFNPPALWKSCELAKRLLRSLALFGLVADYNLFRNRLKLDDAAEATGLVVAVSLLYESLTQNDLPYRLMIPITPLL